MLKHAKPMSEDYKNLDPQDINPDVARKLQMLKKEDINAFSDIILQCLEVTPETVLTDSTPTKDKIRALATLLLNFEGREEFEKCIFIRNLIMDLEDGQ